MNVNGKEIKNKMSNENYEKLVNYMRELLGESMINGRHPTQLICDVIQRFYGHKVKLTELIDLIEGSDPA